MEPKEIFSLEEIDALKELIEKRTMASRNEQKTIRQQMRDMGFYGGKKYGIYNLQLSDLDDLIQSGRITLKE